MTLIAPNQDWPIHIQPHTINRDAHGNAVDPKTHYIYQSDPDFGTPIQAEAGGTYVVMGQRPSPPINPFPLPPANIDIDFGGLPSNSGSSSSSSNAHPMSEEFIEDTYDPELGYEKYDSPGDNPYISNYTPKQSGYMNDLSTLSPDDLGYFKGNVKGLDDRQNSVENAGSFLNNYLLNNNLFKEGVNKTPETKVGTISRESDNESDELYGRNLKESPYDKYDSSKYY